MFRQIKSAVSPQQIRAQTVAFQTAVSAAQVQSTVFQSIISEARVEIVSFRSAVAEAQVILEKTLTNKELEMLTLQKTDLIQIMSDYINQRKTRVDTVDRLKILSTKIA